MGGNLQRFGFEAFEGCERLFLTSDLGAEFTKPPKCVIKQSKGINLF